MSEKLGNSQARAARPPSALACARPGNSHPLKLRIGIPARPAGTNADFSRRDGPENKTRRWVGPSFVSICEVTWELGPRLGINLAIKPSHGDLGQMAASRAPRLPERSWSLSLGCLLPPERGDYSLVALMRRSQGRGDREGRVPGPCGSFTCNQSPGSQAFLFQAKSSSGEATSGTSRSGG